MFPCAENYCNISPWFCYCLAPQFAAFRLSSKLVKGCALFILGKLSRLVMLLCFEALGLAGHEGCRGQGSADSAINRTVNGSNMWPKNQRPKLNVLRQGRNFTGQRMIFLNRTEPASISRCHRLDTSSIFKAFLSKRLVLLYVFLQFTIEPPWYYNIVIQIDQTRNIQSTIKRAQHSPWYPSNASENRSVASRHCGSYQPQAHTIFPSRK